MQLLYNSILEIFHFPSEQFLQYVRGSDISTHIPILDFSPILIQLLVKYTCILALYTLYHAQPAPDISELKTVPLAMKEEEKDWNWKLHQKIRIRIDSQTYHHIQETTELLQHYIPALGMVTRLLVHWLSGNRHVPDNIHLSCTTTQRTNTPPHTAFLYCSYPGPISVYYSLHQTRYRLKAQHEEFLVFQETILQAQQQQQQANVLDDIFTPIQEYYTLPAPIEPTPMNTEPTPFPQEGIEPRNHSHNLAEEDDPSSSLHTRITPYAPTSSMETSLEPFIDKQKELMELLYLIKSMQLSRRQEVLQQQQEKKKQILEKEYRMIQKLRERVFPRSSSGSSGSSGSGSGGSKEKEALDPEQTLSERRNEETDDEEDTNDINISDVERGKELSHEEVSESGNEMMVEGYQVCDSSQLEEFFTAQNIANTTITTTTTSNHQSRSSHDSGRKKRSIENHPHDHHKKKEVHWMESIDSPPPSPSNTEQHYHHHHSNNASHSSSSQLVEEDYLLSSHHSTSTGNTTTVNSAANSSASTSSGSIGKRKGAPKKSNKRSIGIEALLLNLEEEIQHILQKENNNNNNNSTTSRKPPSSPRNSTISSLPSEEKEMENIASYGSMDEVLATSSSHNSSHINHDGNANGGKKRGRPKKKVDIEESPEIESAIQERHQQHAKKSRKGKQGMEMIMELEAFEQITHSALGAATACITESDTVQEQVGEVVLPARKRAKNMTSKSGRKGGKRSIGEGSELEGVVLEGGEGSSSGMATTAVAEEESMDMSEGQDMEAILRDLEMKILAVQKQQQKQKQI